VLVCFVLFVVRYLMSSRSIGNLPVPAASPGHPCVPYDLVALSLESAAP
jgi:hypothetical protein